MPATIIVQAQVLNLLLNLQRLLNLTYLFISHDLSAIRYICECVALIYLGVTVESGSVDDIFQRPQHPYTRALLSAMPEPALRFRGDNAGGGSLPWSSGKAAVV